MLNGADSAEDRAELGDELRWWLAIVREAHARHAELDPLTRAEIDASHSERELGRLALPLANLSTPTRRRMERVLLAALAAADGAPVSRRAECVRPAPGPGPLAHPVRLRVLPPRDPAGP